MGCGSSRRGTSPDSRIEPICSANTSAKEGDDVTDNSPRTTHHGDQDGKVRFSYFENLALFAHNHFRELHESPAVRLNRDLCRLAEKLSQRMARSEQLDQCPPEDRMYDGQVCGENLFWKQDTTLAGDEAVKSWYNERRSYDFSSPGLHEEAAHFSQLVWAESREVGVAYTESARGVAVVAVYLPAGNIEGQFNKNVLPPQVA